ncbi:DUF4363 family protein [Garciella nitratireducens]|uniref:DUF4363 family protein n=1 Tax=Garciella nitratireducens DSM 15102 TaxID=1121911 RepID=A0A1T4N1D2_9FIRM|nr:DUF4363 family protein [Garciella nitratireducens]SJZ72827.1 protein of unknown function [Garciella nitratireducens DSM 15102]
MRKFLVVMIPIVTLSCFILIMLSGSFLKRSLGEEDNISQIIETIMKNIQNENWEEVHIEMDELERVWNKIVKRIQISSEREEINSFNSNIARLRGAILAKDRSSALIELSEAYNHWKNISN